MDGDALAALSRLVAARFAGEAAKRDWMERQDLERLARDLGTAPVERAVAAQEMPVCRHWRAALDDASGIEADLVRLLTRVEGGLRWVRNANYTRDHPEFLENYAYTQLIGPGGPGENSRASVGLLLLAPQFHCLAHAHPAPEIYWPLGAWGEWYCEGRGWRREAPGALIHHPPWHAHATRSEARPMLALYAWTGDLATPSQLLGVAPR